MSDIKTNNGKRSQDTYLLIARQIPAKGLFLQPDIPPEFRGSSSSIHELSIRTETKESEGKKERRRREKEREHNDGESSG